jgi:hypothetical protein
VKRRRRRERERRTHATTDQSLQNKKQKKRKWRVTQEMGEEKALFAFFFLSTPTGGSPAPRQASRQASVRSHLLAPSAVAR